MNYTKPEIVPSGSALYAIQSGQKGDFTLQDVAHPTSSQKTNGAYEADE